MILTIDFFFYLKFFLAQDISSGTCTTALSPHHQDWRQQRCLKPVVLEDVLDYLSANADDATP